MYHISDIKKYIRCPKYFYLDQMKEKEEYHSFVRLDESITSLAAKKLGVDMSRAFVGKRNDDPSLAIEALKHYDWLINARFTCDLLRVKVPFLHQVKDGWEIIFVYPGLYPHANDIQVYRDTLWALENNGFKILDVHVLHLNQEYVRRGELDTDALFILSSHLYNTSHHETSLTMLEQLRNDTTDLKQVMTDMKKGSLSDFQEMKRTKKCTGKNKCPFYHICFPEEDNIDNSSILTLVGSNQKYVMKEKGVERLRDADTENFEGSPMQYAQIAADSADGLFVDKLALKNWLSHIQYPIAFLDFEWERFAIPPYDGMRPYDVLPFEYALHVLYEDGRCESKVYLNVHDDRRDMAENLLKDIPQTGSIVAYNAEGAEKIRIQEFAEYFEDLRDPLLALNERMEDLQLPFISGTVYDVRMKGQWTLKKIMSILDEESYQKLSIRQGMEAVFEWRHLDSDEEIDEEKKNQIISDLKKYCGMDSYAMIVVYEWLKKISI